MKNSEHKFKPNGFFKLKQVVSLFIYPEESIACAIQKDD